MAVAMLTRSKVKTFPVIEIFGPTIQGEGAEAGLTCHFVRLGGCDFRCSWCDTMYAVDPVEVRINATLMSASEITSRLASLDGAPRWVVISGGNPALHKIDSLIAELHRSDRRVAVETQGSVWRDWLADVDRLTVSPKPPSSGMTNHRHITQFERFMARAVDGTSDRLVLKIVCFEEIDLQWSMEVASRYSSVPLYLSAGTPVPAPAHLRDAVGERYAWLCERVAAEPALSDARVLPQLHVIAWKDRSGV
jgi:7-carboxy-7-deazaguanine synthase